MKRLRWTRYAMVCLLLCATVLSAAGCSKASKPVAEVNGTKITYGEYSQVMEEYLANYNMTMDTMTETLGEEQAAEYRSSIVDMIVLQKLMMEKAKELGLDTISEDEHTQSQAQAQEYLDYLKDSYVQEVQAEASEQPSIDVTKESEKRYDDEVKRLGYTLEYLTERNEQDMILERVYNAMLADAQVTDEMIQAYYDENLELQKQTSLDNPEDALQNHIDQTNDVELYLPETITSIRMIKHILIALPDDVISSISTMRSNDQGQQATALRAQELNKIFDKATEVLAKAQAGEDFNTLVETYGEDPGMTEEPQKSKGYEVYEGVSMVDEFVEASLALPQVGAISDLVATDYGYHILQYVGSPTPGPVALEEVHDAIYDLLLVEQQDAVWEQSVKDLTDAATIVKYPENY